MYILPCNSKRMPSDGPEDECSVLGGVTKYLSALTVLCTYSNCKGFEVRVSTAGIEFRAETDPRRAMIDQGWTNLSTDSVRSDEIRKLPTSIETNMGRCLLC